MLDLRKLLVGGLSDYALFLQRGLMVPVGDISGPAPGLDWNLDSRDRFAALCHCCSGPASVVSKEADAWHIPDVLEDTSPLAPLLHHGCKGLHPMYIVVEGGHQHESGGPSWVKVSCDVCLMILSGSRWQV